MDFKIPKLTQRGDFEWLLHYQAPGHFAQLTACQVIYLVTLLTSNNITG